MLVYKGEQITPAEALQLLNSDDAEGGLPYASTATKPLYGTHWEYCATRLAMANEEPDDIDLRESLNQAIKERGQDLFDLAVAVNEHFTGSPDELRFITLGYLSPVKM